MLNLITDLAHRAYAFSNLDLSSNDIKGPCFNPIAIFQNPSALKTLRLARTSFDLPPLKTLYKILPKNLSLTSLNLHACYDPYTIPTNHLAKIPVYLSKILKRLPNLQHLPWSSWHPPSFQISQTSPHAEEIRS